MSANPFLDPARLGELYGDAARLTHRSGALLRAKTTGRPVPEVIARLISAHRPATRPNLVVDLGCGRGTSSQALLRRLAPERLVGIDASAALLAEARRRVHPPADIRVEFIRADFHDVPVSARSCAAAVAAFCLYHSPRPQQVISEIARFLSADGVAVLVTKSLDSYRELDALVAEADLDPAARTRESLYASAHSANLADLAATALIVTAVEHEQHTFTFDGLDHVAEYLATNPKYTFPDGWYGNPAALAAALRKRRPDRPVTTRSTVTYVVAHPGGGRA